MPYNILNKYGYNLKLKSSIRRKYLVVATNKLGWRRVYNELEKLAQKIKTPIRTINDMKWVKAHFRPRLTNISYKND